VLDLARANIIEDVRLDIETVEKPKALSGFIFQPTEGD
jgi:hypothetical protein